MEAKGKSNLPVLEPSPTVQVQEVEVQAMTMIDARGDAWPRKLFLKAVGISLAFHLLCFGVWKVGKGRGWWQASFSPAWMQAMTRKITAQMARNQPPKQAPHATPMLYIDVDPALIQTEAPKNAKFYGAANTKAANPTIDKPSDVPKIEGTQEQMLKTIDNGRNNQPKPLQPSPAPQPVAAAPAETQARPKASFQPGDLAMVRPSNNAQPSKTADKGTADSKGNDAETQHMRPRTLDEARERLGIPGPKTRQTGGSPNFDIASSLDVSHSIVGDYDREFIDAVRQRWYDLLGQRGGVSQIGKVVLDFRLNSDGHITEMKVVQENVGELQSLIAQSAILDPHFRKWPDEMRRELGADFRDVRFTFYYMEE